MMNPKINGLMADAVRRVLRGVSRTGAASDAAKRPGRQGSPSCESLEGRVVLSNWGGADLLGGLSQIGVATSVLGDAGGPRGGPMMDAPGGGRTSSADADVQALQTTVQGLAAKSGVTVADLSALSADTKAIETAGGGIKVDDLQAVLGSLATAVAGGADTTQAQSDFNALFSGSKVDQATIDKTFTDLVQTIKDSKITTTDLTDFASALSTLPKPGDAMKDPGFGGAPGGFNGAGSQGDALTAGLARAGVVAVPADPQGVAGKTTAPGGGAKADQLQTDLDKLRTDQQTVAAKSAVSSDELDQLKTDDKDITSAGLKIDPKSLQTVINNLVTAVAGGADTSQVQSDFTALFSGSKVDQTVIDRTFDDLVQTIQDSKITSDDASLIADDQAAVQADLDALPQGGPGGFAMGPQGGQSGFAQGGPGGMFAGGEGSVSVSRGGPGGISMSRGVQVMDRGGPGMIQGMAQGGQGIARGGSMVQVSRSTASPVAQGGQGGGAGVSSTSVTHDGSATLTSSASGAVHATPADAVRPTDMSVGNDPGGPTEVAPNAQSVSDNVMGARGRSGVRGRFARSLAGRFGRGATGSTQAFSSGAAHQVRSATGFRRG